MRETDLGTWSLSQAIALVLLPSYSLVREEMVVLESRPIQRCFRSWESRIKLLFRGGHSVRCLESTPPPHAKPSGSKLGSWAWGWAQLCMPVGLGRVAAWFEHLGHQALLGWLCWGVARGLKGQKEEFELSTILTRSPLFLADCRN